MEKYPTFFFSRKPSQDVLANFTFVKLSGQDSFQPTV